MTPAIRIENLSKKFVINSCEKPGSSYISMRDVLSDGFKTFGRNLISPHKALLQTQKKEFWALRDINIEVNQGEKLAILGHNGAGKSTLLKILSQIIEPTTGKISINGRIASLLEVGTGFHPELTGRENIFLNGSILGMRRNEIKRKFDEIVDFAGVELFLDTPVKRYSSGMRMRLGFAVAANLESEILVIDEVLAVGDAEFQKKCLGKMDQVSKSEGRTILFVSHNMSAITQLCDRGHVLHAGGLVFSGTTGDAVGKYLELVNNQSGTVIKKDPSVLAFQLPERKFLLKNEDINFTLILKLTEDIDDCFFDVAIYNFRNDKIVHIFNEDKRKYFDLKKGTNSLAYKINSLSLSSGSYSAVLYVSKKGKSRDIFSIKDLPLFDIVGHGSPSGLPPVLEPGYDIIHQIEMD